MSISRSPSMIVPIVVGTALVTGCSPANENPSPNPPETSTAISQPADSQPPTSQPAISPVIAPVTVPVSELAGSQQNLVEGQVLNIVVPAADLDAYSPESTPDFLAFRQGYDDGGARFNPGFSATAPGQGEVTLESPQTITFTVTVEQ